MRSSVAAIVPFKRHGNKFFAAFARLLIMNTAICVMNSLLKCMKGKDCPFYYLLAKYQIASILVKVSTFSNVVVDSFQHTR